MSTLAIKSDWTVTKEDSQLASAATVGSVVAFAASAFAVEDVEGMVAAAIEMVESLNTIAGAAFNVVLLPFGAMTAIKMLSMVLARV